MAKAKRRRLAAIEKQNKNVASIDVFPRIPGSVENINISDLLEVQPQQIEYRKQRVIVLIPPLPTKNSEYPHGRAHWKPKKLVSKVLDIRNQQAPTLKSGDTSSGPLKLILKHGTWRREKLIGKFHFPAKNIAPKVVERPVANQVYAQESSVEPPMKETNMDDNTHSKDLGHEIPDDTTLLEVQKVLARPAPNLSKENYEAQIGSKLEDRLSGDRCEMAKQDTMKAMEIKKDLLQAHVECPDTLDNTNQGNTEKKTSLQGSLGKIKADDNCSGLNFTPQPNKEESACLQQQNSDQKDNETLFRRDIRPTKIGDAVTSGRWIKNKVGVIQSSLQTHNTCLIRLPRFCKNSFVPSQLVPLCMRKPDFGSFHGPMFEKKEKINLVQQKLEKAGGLQSWLVKSGLGQFVKLFQEKNVEISELLELNMGALKQMGAAAVGPRRKLIHAIDSLF